MKLVITLFLTLIIGMSQAQKTLPLYEGAIPNARPAENLESRQMNKDGWWFTEKISVPTITRYDPLPKLKNGMTVIICPGGGYRGTADKHEGVDIAAQFTARGITAFVLKYRVPTDRTMIDKSVGPLQDVQQAVRWVRRNAAKWGLRPDRIGVMGFSAGGHLAASSGVHFGWRADPSVTDTISVRPNFLMLIYPVISFNETITHKGSRQNLLGDTPSVESLQKFSCEAQVSALTPPTFLVHAADDNVVKSENSIVFYQACLKNKVPAEMHLYAGGGHGFGLVNKTTKDRWMERLINWLDSQKLRG
jgi:acetyl esterase/lipase